MNERLLKYLIYVGGAICLYAFIAVRVEPLYNAVLVEKKEPEHFEFTKYGELYYFSQISHFKEDLPKPIRKFRYSEKQSKLEDADIVTFGDSFFDFSRVKTVPERLADSLHKKVHAIYSFYPFNYFNHIGYKRSSKKVFIYETVERMIPIRFDQPQNSQEELVDWGSPGIARKVLDWVFPTNVEERLTTLLKGSYFTRPAYSAISTFKFDEFGYISSKTPLYSLRDKPWLFYYESVNDEVTGFYYHHSQEEIDKYCDNIATMGKELKEKYNFDFVFCPIPNKYTLYFDKVDKNAKYDEFLPRIFKGLEKRGVDYVDVYDEFIDMDSVLYFGTDSHWNDKGAQIAVDKIIEQILK
ncbi:MAG: hypothetical protein GXO89_09620 [Chlorobi bacterium]|nr:hypothetical protein [Chlorobiota bacterium]